MAVSLTHTTVAVGTDAGNGEIAKAQWNQNHTLTAAVDNLLGTTSLSTSVVEISCTAAGRALLDDANAAAQRTTLGVGTGDSPTFTGITLSGVGALSAGSASLPSLIPSGDTNTGMWFPAADAIALSTGGSERIRLSPNGAIGLSGANYGTSGQVLTSAGSAAAPTWTTVGGSSFPSGTLMLFQQTTAPTGWTKQTTHDNKALRVVSGTASSGGSVAFSTAFASQSVSGTVGNTTATGSLDSVTVTGTIVSATATGTVGATTLTVAQMPQHRHSTSFLQNTNTTATGGFNRLSSGGVTLSLDTSQQGSSSSHDHSFTGTSHTHTFNGGSHSHTFTGTSHNHTFTGTAINLAVQYVDLIIASKD